MKYLALFSLIVGLTAAADCQQEALKIPECARTCVDEQVSSVGCSGPKDFKCLCKNMGKLQVASLPCAQKKAACTSAVIADAIDVSAKFCKICG